MESSREHPKENREKETSPAFRARFRGRALLVAALFAAFAVSDGPTQPASAPQRTEDSVLAAAPVPTATATPKPVRTPTPRPSKPEASYILSATSPEPANKQPLASLRIRIASIGVNAPIVPTGVESDGEMEAPKGPDDVGWYNASAIPGQVGNAVLSGHIDWKTRTAVFWKLRELKPGDRIDIYSPEGIEQTFIVAWRQLYPYNAVPLADVLARSAQPILTIVTCAGQFDRATQNYSDRLVVRAAKM